MVEVVFFERPSRLAAQIISRALATDSDLSFLARNLSGTLRLSFVEWAISIVFVSNSGSLQVLPFYEYTEVPDVTLEGKLSDFIPLIGRESGNLAQSALHAEGNVHLLAQYQAFFRSWNFDWGNALASLLGETPARALYGIFRKTADFVKSVGQERFEDLQEVLFEEKRLLVSKEELETFYDDLKALQLRVDRLGARF